jgi:hypothetical protein
LWIYFELIIRFNVSTVNHLCLFHPNVEKQSFWCCRTQRWLCLYQVLVGQSSLSRLSIVCNSFVVMLSFLLSYVSSYRVFWLILYQYVFIDLFHNVVVDLSGYGFSFMKFISLSLSISLYFFLTCTNHWHFFKFYIFMFSLSNCGGWFSFLVLLPVLVLLNVFMNNRFFCMRRSNIEFKKIIIA